MPLGSLVELTVVTLGAVHLQDFDVGEADGKAGAEHAVLRNHNIVAEFGTNDDDRIRSFPSIDVYFCVDRVLDEVFAAAAGQIRSSPRIFL